MIKSNLDVVVDMPKLKSPFIRKTINGQYVVTPEIDPDYQWVFDEPAVKAVEKLHGTNVSVVVDDGEITKIFNRKTRIRFWSGNPIIKCVLTSCEKGWIDFTKDGQYFGEAMGGKIQANPLDLKVDMWMPFALAQKKLMYTSFYEHDRTFENWSNWFKDYLFSLMARKYAKDKEKKVFAEGVVFYHPDGVRMAKLRRDMFDWFKGSRHKAKPPQRKEDK